MALLNNVLIAVRSVATYNLHCESEGSDSLRYSQLAEVRHCASHFEFFRGQFVRKSLPFNRAGSKIGCSENLPPCLPTAGVTDCLHVPAKDSHP